MDAAMPDPFRLATADDLRRVARARFPTGEGEHGGDFLLNPESREAIAAGAARPAAVLIPIVERLDGLRMVLTKRRDDLKSHSGQIAFPGGKIDPDDASAEAAALREANEEVGLDPALAEVVGRLPDYLTGSGYRIAPVVALIDASARLAPNPAEVDYIFEVPLSFLMDAGNHRTGSRELMGRQRHFFEMPFEGHYIWGVTAGIIRVLHDRLQP